MRPFSRSVTNPARRQLLREIAEAAHTVIALRERGIELQQRALQQPELRRDLAIAEDLQRAAHQRHRLVDRRRRGPSWPEAAAPRCAAPAARQVLVGDELVAVALHHLAGERSAADDEHLLAVLLQFLHEGNEVAVPADDHVGVDVRMRERHLQRIEREVDVRAVLVAAGREVTLDEFRRVLRERAAVVSRARPVAVSDLRDDLAALLQRFEHDADVELRIEGALDSDFDVVEIDEYSDFQACFCQTL